MFAIAPTTTGTNFRALDTIVVGSIATLKTLTGMRDKQQASVASYYESATPDGGGGIFVWDSTSSATANDGTIIAPDAGGVGRWRRVYSGAVTPQDFGSVIGQTNTIVTTKMQAAIDFCSTNKLKLEVPAGTYTLLPATTVTDEGGTAKTALTLKSDLDIWAHDGATFKIQDSVSTDSVPQPLYMFFSNSTLSNISMRGLTLDMNGANNKISPSRPTTYNTYNMAHIAFSGTPAGVAARADDVLIEGCKFLNTSGTNAIIMAQSNTAGVTLGKRWTVRNNLFNNNGLDTSDHSTVYGWADDVLIDGNTFTADTMHGTTGKTGMLAAYEVHGANQRFTNNKVRNAYRGLWISSNLTSNSENIVIANNEIGPVKFYGADVYHESASALPLKNVVIHDNLINFDNTTAAVAPDTKVGVQIASAIGVSEFNIHDNEVIASGTLVASAGVAINPQTTVSQTHSNIFIHDNIVRAATAGVQIKTNGTNGLGAISITGNKTINLQNSGGGSVATGVNVGFTGSATAVKTLTVGGNEFLDEQGSPTTSYGISIAGTITDLFLNPNTYKGMTVANYFENSPTITNRHGDFDNVSFTPVWGAGGAITLGNGSVRGRYSLKGTTVSVVAELTVGSTTSFPGGNLTLDLPFASAVSGIRYQGQGSIFDNSAGTITLGTSTVDGTASQAQIFINGALFATNSSPVVLATSDVVRIQIEYQRVTP